MQFDDPDLRIYIRKKDMEYAKWIKMDFGESVLRYFHALCLTKFRKHLSIFLLRFGQCFGR